MKTTKTTTRGYGTYQRISMLDNEINATKHSQEVAALEAQKAEYAERKRKAIEALDKAEAYARKLAKIAWNEKTAQTQQAAKRASAAHMQLLKEYKEEGLLRPENPRIVHRTVKRPNGETPQERDDLTCRECGNQIGDWDVKNFRGMCHECYQDDRDWREERARENERYAREWNEFTFEQNKGW